VKLDVNVKNFSMKCPLSLIQLKILQK